MANPALKMTNGAEPVSSYDLDPKEVNFYKSEGWLLLPQLLKHDHVDALREDILKIVTGYGTKQSELAKASTSAHKLIQTSQYLAGTPVDGLVNSAKLRAVASKLLDGGCEIYQPFTAVKSGGGGGEFHFHQDNNYTRFEDGLLGINFWFALVDMTPENGCLCIAPRTHATGTLSSENVGQNDHHVKVSSDPDHYLPVRMRAGDAVVFSRLTVHGSGTNKTPHPRVGYSVQFFRSDTLATWNGQSPRRLSGANRFRTGPVAKIDPAAQD